METKIWVLCTVLADENAPAMPAVFADEAEAWAKYDEAIRAVMGQLDDRFHETYPLQLATLGREMRLSRGWHMIRILEAPV
jgi:hypothetical protein